MKLWYALHKNLTSQPGRFLYEVGGAPRPEACLPEVERSEVLGACTGELVALQDQFENETFKDLVDFIKTEADVATQRQFLSNRTLASSQLRLDPNLPENVRTAVTQRLNAIPFAERLSLMPAGIMDDILRLQANRTITLLTQHPEAIKKLETPTIINVLREISIGANTSPEAREVIINKAKESDLIRFISTNPELIPLLCTNQQENPRVVNFYGNEIFNHEISSTQLFPEARYIRSHTDQGTYRATANGFRAFYQRTRSVAEVRQSGDLYNRSIPINQKAFAVDGSVFEIVTSDQVLTEEENTALASLEGHQILEPPTETSEHYEINQAYALNFKMLTNEMSHNLPDNISPALQTDIQNQAMALRVFLDGRRFLLEGEMPTRDGYQESVLAGVPPIDYNASPAEVQAATEAALFRITNHFENQILARYQSAQAEGISETERTNLLAEATAIQASLKSVGASMGTLIERMQADSITVRDQNQLSISTRLESYGLSDEIIQGYWEQLNDPEVSSLEKQALVDQILAEAEASFRSLDTSNIPATERQALMNSLRRDLLTHARNSDAVDQGIQLTESLRRLEFLSTYRRDYFYPVLQVSQNLGLTLPASLVSAFASGQFDRSHVNALESFVRSNQASYQTYFNSPAGSNAPETNAIQHFLNQDATAEFRTQLVKINQQSQQRVTEATGRRKANADWVSNTTYQLRTYFEPDGTRNLSTPEAQAYHQGNDLRGQAYTSYYHEHGVMPPPDARLQIEQSVTQQVHTTQLQGIAEFKQQPPSTQAELYTQIYYVPPQANVVGITPNGQYILESPGPDQTTYLQNPTDGTIIAEQLTGVPDSEDLRVPPEEWATAQALAAMTDSFVIKSAAELAQAGETLGNVALVNFMRQYWGIRGHSTLSESELDQFKSLGAMMSDNYINLHTVLQQLNATKWDETAAGNRAVSVRYQFNEILAAAAAGNNTGFRDLLGLDELPSDELKTGPDLIA